MMRRPSLSPWSRFRPKAVRVALFARFLPFLLLFAGGGAFAAGVPKPEEAEAEAIKVVAEMRALEPGLPKLDVPPVAVAAKLPPLTLVRALEIAIANNADIRTRRERVKLDALGLVAARHGYGPQWRATLSATRSEAGVTLDGLRTSTQYTDSFQGIGFSQRLPFGGSVSVDLGGAYSQVEDLQGDYSPRAIVSLTQPLLRGAGRDLQREPRVAAEHALLDSLRGYRLTVENFAIGVIRDFLTIQNLRAKIRSREDKRDAFERLIKRSEAFYKLGRESEIEVLRATQERLLVEQQLLDLELDLKNRLELFAVTLNLNGMPPLELVEFEIPVHTLRRQPEEIVARALAARPDLRSAAAAVEDCARKLKFARRGLLPDLDLKLAANASNSDVRTGTGVLSEEYLAGLTFSLPLERTKERLSVFGAVLTLAQSQRELATARANVAAGVRYGANQIKSYENALKIQDSIVDSSLQGVKIAGFRFERGEASNRTVIDANTALSNAINARLDLRLAHYIASLQLRRDMGLLDTAAPALLLQ